MEIYAFILVVGVCAGTLSGVVGTGSTIILLPVLVYQFGPKQAVPVMAVAALMSKIGKVFAWWREVDWRAFAAYSVTGVPAAALGARTLLVLPPQFVDVALGLFFLAMVPVRHLLHASRVRIALWQLAVAGAFIGFLTGIVISTGPLSVPAFTSYGLAKGAFLSTEAASSLALFISKIATFRELGALPGQSIIAGLIIGASVMAGSFIGKAIVQRLSANAFHRLIDGLLVCSGLSLLWDAMR